MVATDRVYELITDARRMQEAALERLEAGDVRDAAEKSWCATKRATDALILARTGDEPVTTARTSDGADELERVDPSLTGRYYSRLSTLHGSCFYDGRCSSPHVERRIRETGLYIEDVERLL